MKLLIIDGFAPNERVRNSVLKLTHFCLFFVYIILNLMFWLFGFFFSSIFFFFIRSETEINDHCITFSAWIVFVCICMVSINLIFFIDDQALVIINSKINQLTNHFIGKTEPFKRAKSYKHWIIFFSSFH